MPILPIVLIMLVVTVMEGSEFKRYWRKPVLRSTK